MRIRLRSITAVAVLSMVATLVSPSAVVGAAAQTVEDIEVRDRLISAQEALLNVYRCRFNIDTQIVPGGCTDGVPATEAANPQPFAGTPTDAEIAARDTLIQAQEALLNVYRCRFDIDTQIVPGGCTEGEPATGDEAPAPQQTLIAAGGSHSCAIRPDQTITCWGNNEDWQGNTTGQTDAPEGQYIAIAAGGRHSCAIRPDQTITCWGNNGSGQTDVPEGQYTTIAAGGSHSCAIRTDQTMTCWGENTSLMENPDEGYTEVFTGVATAPQGEYTAIAAGVSYSCAIRTDQTITCWGDKFSVPLDAPPGLHTAVSTGTHFLCAIGTDQTIACWGNNDVGQTDAPDGQYTAIAAGSSFSCAIRTDQTITCWGRNEDGQLDAPQGQYTAITAGTRHLCAVRTDQTITCWGNNEHGQLDAPDG